MKTGIGRDSSLTYFTCEPGKIGSEFEVEILEDTLKYFDEINKKYWEYQHLLEGLYEKARKGDKECPCYTCNTGLLSIGDVVGIDLCSKDCKEFKEWLDRGE